jgi:hypothetical protein
LGAINLVNRKESSIYVFLIKANRSDHRNNKMLSRILCGGSVGNVEKRTWYRPNSKLKRIALYNKICGWGNIGIHNFNSLGVLVMRKSAVGFPLFKFLSPGSTTPLAKIHVFLSPLPPTALSQMGVFWKGFLKGGARGGFLSC